LKTRRNFPLANSFGRIRAKAPIEPPLLQHFRSIYAAKIKI